MKVHSGEKLEKLKQLRASGHSINEIVQELKMPKTTVWHHVRKVKVPQKYIKLLSAKQAVSKEKSETEWVEARLKAKTLIENIGPKERLLIAASLYWAEGSKSDFCLTNTDPALIEVFLSCLKEHGITQNNVKVSLRIYEDIDPTKAKIFWSNITGVAFEEIVSVSVLKGKKNGKLAYGMCRVRLKKGGKTLKLMTALKEIIVSKLK